MTRDELIFGETRAVWRRRGLWAAVLLYLLLVWPGRWHFQTAGNTLYRVDRIGGCYQTATDSGWSRPWGKTC